MQLHLEFAALIAAFAADKIDYRETLIQMKASAARPQDLADIVKLKDIDR